MLKFTCLLFLNPENIPSSSGKRFKNWIEVYNYHGNPKDIFLLIENISSLVTLEILFPIRKKAKKKFQNNKINSIDWGPIADNLSQKFIWIRDYSDCKTNSESLITLEIFDTLVTQLRKYFSTSKKIAGNVYTPYQFAAYIAEESFIYWLRNNFHEFSNTFSDLRQIDELDLKTKHIILGKVESIKICDPALGTGVFLFAAANLLIRILRILNPTLSIEKIKSLILKRNLYGIDIDPIAIRISQMKFWLWIYNQKSFNLTDPISFKCNLYSGDALFGFQKLPLEYSENKIVEMELKKRKTLLDLYYDHYFFEQFNIYEIMIPSTTNQKINQLFNTCASLLKYPGFQYFILEGDRAVWNREKESLDSKILKKIRYSISSSQISDFKLYAVFSSPIDLSVDKSLAYHLESKRNLILKFHWADFNFPKFDLIIGNPPFVALTDMPMIVRKMLQKVYPEIYTGNNDLSYFFITRALSALNTNNGILSFILPKYILHSLYARKIRKCISKSASILEIHDLTDFTLFQNINIKSIIIHLKKSHTPADQSFIYNKYQKNGSQVLRKPCRVYQFNLKPEKWILLDWLKLNILYRIRENSNLTLKDVANISKGIETGCDHIFAPKDPFYFSRVLKINKSHVKPWIKGKDITQFSLWRTEREVLFAPNYRNDEISTNKKIMSYLERNKNQLFNRSRILKYYLWRSGDERKTIKWENPKIVTPYKAPKNTFAIDWNGCLSSKDVVWIVPKKKYSDKDFLLFIVALLNSKVLTFFALNSIKDLGGLYEYYPKQIEDFPLVVPKFDTTEYTSVCKLTSKIIKCKDEIEKNLLEERLNNLIFGIYGLSQKDKQFIMEFSN
ncbi:MAG: Eco57I restriction-modification methylase domain-containing protein [Promethearchaeota archaeon]